MKSILAALRDGDDAISRHEFKHLLMVHLVKETKLAQMEEMRSVFSTASDIDAMTGLVRELKALGEALEEVECPEEAEEMRTLASDGEAKMALDRSKVSGVVLYSYVGTGHEEGIEIFLGEILELAQGEILELAQEAEEAEEEVAEAEGWVRCIRRSATWKEIEAEGMVPRRMLIGGSSLKELHKHARAARRRELDMSREENSFNEMEEVSQSAIDKAHVALREREEWASRMLDDWQLFEDRIGRKQGILKSLPCKQLEASKNTSNIIATAKGRVAEIADCVGFGLHLRDERVHFYGEECFDKQGDS